MSCFNTSKIALQLYTVRDCMASDISGTLGKLADIGIQNVETAFWPPDISIKDAGKLLKQFGLKVCSAHCDMPIGDKRDQVLAITETFECNKVIWHGWPQDDLYQSYEGILELIDIYNECNDWSRANDLEFGLHNHWWEFMNVIGKEVPYDLLINQLAKEIFFEVDVYWLKVAEWNPEKLSSDFRQRVKCLHLKDGPARWYPNLASDMEPMVSLGDGRVDFTAVHNAFTDTDPWLVIEMDQVKGDVFTAIERSVSFLNDFKTP